MVPGLPDLPNWETVKDALDPEVQNVLLTVFDLFLRCVVPDVEWKVNFETRVKNFWNHITVSDIAFIFFVLEVNLDEWLDEFKSKKEGRPVVKQRGDSKKGGTKPYNTKALTMYQRKKIFRNWMKEIRKHAENEHEDFYNDIEAAYKKHRAEVMGIATPGDGTTNKVQDNNNDNDADDDFSAVMQPLQNERHFHTPDNTDSVHQV